MNPVRKTLCRRLFNRLKPVRRFKERAVRVACAAVRERRPVGKVDAAHKNRYVLLRAQKERELHRCRAYGAERRNDRRVFMHKLLHAVKKRRLTVVRKKKRRAAAWYAEYRRARQQIRKQGNPALRKAAVCAGNGELAFYRGNRIGAKPSLHKRECRRIGRKQIKR